MAREKGEIKNQRRILDASYNSVRTVSSIYDDKIIVKGIARESETRINNIYDILEELKENLPLACKKHLLDYSSNSTIINNVVIKAISNSHLFGFLLPEDINEYAKNIEGNPENLNSQIANSYYDFFIEPVVEDNFNARLTSSSYIYGLELKIKQMLNSKEMSVNISEFIELFHEYIGICDKNNIPSYWLKGDSVNGVDPDLTGMRFNEEVFKKVYSCLGKKKTILTSKITDDYELLFYWIVNKLKIENKALPLIKSKINEYISNRMTKADLEEFNYVYGKKIKFNKGLLKEGIASTIERVKVVITNTYKDDYHAIFYHIASRMHLDRGIPIEEAITHVNNYIESNLTKNYLKYLNKRYDINVPYDIEKIKKNISKINLLEISKEYIPQEEYLSKEILETTKFLSSIDRFNEDVFKHYRLNCNMPMSKKDKLSMFANYDIPLIFDQILKKYEYRMTKNNGLCLIKKNRDSRGTVFEKEIKIRINLLKCRDKVNSFFNLPQISNCIGYFSFPKINFMSNGFFSNSLMSSEYFWNIVTSTQIPMAYSLMYGNEEEDKTLLYFESSDEYSYSNSGSQKLENPTLGKYYLKELRHGGEVNCFSMINNVPIYMNDKGNFVDSLYFSGWAECMIGVRKKSKKQSIWFQVENKKILEDKTEFLKELRNEKLDFDFSFLERESVLKYSKNGLDTITSLNKQLAYDMTQSNSEDFFRKIEKLKNDKYVTFGNRYNKLKRLQWLVSGELNYYSPNGKNFRKNVVFDVNKIFGLEFNEIERKEVLEKLNKELENQIKDCEMLINIEKYSLNIPENKFVKVNGDFFLQLMNLYKTLEYGDNIEKNSDVINNIIDRLLECYEKLDYSVDINYALENNLPSVTYPIIVAKLCNLYNVDNINPEAITNLKQFIDFVKRIKSKINPGITIVR